MPNARVFVAVFPPLELRRALALAARELPVGGDVRWVRPENLHFTLKFVGEVAAGTLDSIARALEPIGARHEPFEVVISGFGAFPTARRAKVLWTGVAEGADALGALARDVGDSLSPLGFAREKRPFVPHLTVGRARGRPVRLGRGPQPGCGAAFSVRTFELVESVLGASGSAYRALRVYELPSEGRDKRTDGHDDEE